MVLGQHHEIWTAMRRIAETRGRIAALEDIRLRLIEMGETASADAATGQIDRLRKGLDYHRHVLVAVQARLARSCMATDGPKAGKTPHGPADLPIPLRRPVPRNGPSAPRATEDAA
jgi:hypothetical protein